MTPSIPERNRRRADSMPGDADNGAAKQNFEEDAKDVKRELGAKAREQAVAGQHRLADEADTLSDAINAAASNLDDHDREGLARYARKMSSTIANAAGQLEGRSVDELANDAKRLARDNPALFMVGSIAVGFGLSRFFKASAERDHHDENRDQQTGAYRNDAPFPDDDVLSGTAMPGRARDTSATNQHTNMTATAPGSSNGRDMP